MAENNVIELLVDLHPNGSLTLMHKDPDKDRAHDLYDWEGLTCNGDRASFYRAVARYMAHLSGDGKRFIFVDTEEPALGAAA